MSMWAYFSALKSKVRNTHKSHLKPNMNHISTFKPLYNTIFEIMISFEELEEETD